MAKKAVKTTAVAPAAPVKETMGSRFNKAVAKSKEFGKNVVDKAKAAGAKAKAAGIAAKAHVCRNKAAYIAGGLGAAGVATAAGIAARNRKRAAQEEN